jgi:hypothetical protein
MVSRCEPIRNSLATFGFMLQRSVGVGGPQEHSPEEERLMSQAGAKRRMSRRLVWMDQIRLRGFGCSECAWVFNPTGNAFNEMMRKFEVRRDREFSSHVCADHPKNTSANS